MLDALTEGQAMISAKNQRKAKAKVQNKSKWKNIEHAREKQKIGGTAGNESCTGMIRTPLSERGVLSCFPHLLSSYKMAVRVAWKQMDANESVGGGGLRLRWLPGRRVSCYCNADMAWPGMAQPGRPSRMIASQLFFILMYVKG